MNPELAIKVLEERKSAILEDARIQVAQLDAAIHSLRTGKPVPAEVSKSHTSSNHFPTIKPGQYAGMDKKSALQAYLNERPGGVLVTKAAVDLTKAGVKMGKKEQSYRRYLRITISSNPKTFHYDEENDMVRLVSEAQQKAS